MEIQAAKRADLTAYAEFACSLADAARAVTLPRWRTAGAAENKAGEGGFDPVTEADRAAERAMRALIEYRYPNHGISGEEYPERAARGRYAWSLDPIDGTRAYVCGLPSWTVLIALLDEGEPVLGLIDAPRLNERYLGFCDAARLAGEGGGPLATSACASLAEARLSTTDPYLFTGAAADAFARLRGAARQTRYGYDAYGYARLADGSIDLVVEAGLKPHDYNALIPVVRGAGGTIGNWRGGADLTGGDIVAAANPELFDQAVALLNRH